MINLFLSPVTILLYGLAFRANFKKMSAKYFPLLIIIWGAVLLLINVKYYDSFLTPPLSLGSSLLGLLPPLLYLIYRKIKKNEEGFFLYDNIKLMMATGFFFGFINSLIYLFLYGIVIFARKKRETPYAFVILPIIVLSYLILFVYFVLPQNGVSTPINIGN
jgi:hypothetical protein